MTRKGYKSTSVRDILEQTGIQHPLRDAIQRVKLDGVPLTERSDTARTPERFDPRVEGKYSEAFAAATAACAIGLTDIEIFTTHDDGRRRETPDLLLCSSNHTPIEIEVVEVDETRPARAHVFRIQAAIATALEQRPHIKTRQNIRFTVDYDRVKSFSPAQFDELAQELIAFFESMIADYLPPGHHGTVFPSNSIASRAGVIVEIDRPTYAMLLTFAQAPSRLPYDGVLSAIDRKRELPYKNTHPLWLVVMVADPRGPFDAALNDVARAKPPISPFERVIVQDGHSAVEIA